MRTEVAITLLVLQGLIVTILVLWNHRGIGKIAALVQTRYQLEKAIVNFSAKLMSSSLPDLDHAIESGLLNVLRTTGAARVCWYVIEEGSPNLEKRYSVVKTGNGASPQSIKAKDIPYTFEKLMKGEPVILHGLSDLPPTAHLDRKFFEQVSVEGLILIPSTCGTSRRGVLAIVSVSSGVYRTGESIGQLTLLNNLMVTTIERNIAHTMLQKSEQRFRCLFQEAPIGIALADTDGKLLFVNPALCSILGFREQELRGHHCSDLVDQEQPDSDNELFQRLLAGEIKRYNVERRFVTKDGSPIWGRTEVSIVRNQERNASLIIMMMEDITERRNSKLELERTRSELQELAGHLIQAHEEERHRISRELHDDIGQRLALIAIDLDILSSNLENLDPEQESKQLYEVKSQVESLTTDVHQLSHQLHSAKLQSLGLSLALEELCRQVSKQHQVQVEYCASSPVSHLPPDLSLCIFRVAQEALSNAVKHSRSQTVSVELTSKDSLLRLKVRDYGVGFDSANASGGIGLLSMRERLRLVGGWLSVESTTGQGTLISALVNTAKDRSVAA